MMNFARIARNGLRQLILPSLVLCATMILLGPLAHAQIISSHPRMILDASTLATLRQRANANTPQWQHLKNYCDNVLGGAVYYPENTTWASPPKIGSNYQGHGYINAVMSLGMCYRVMQGIDASQANAYGVKLAQVLNVISMPYPGAHGVNPCTDAGYGIRNYGVALGIGYDWGYDKLNARLRAQVITAGNRWLHSFETASCSFYQRIHPLSNYYAGYFHAKASIALGTWGDNVKAPSEWDDWLNNRFKKAVLPYYTAHMENGGWPEGFANYGPYATLSMILPAREVKTATGIDLLHPNDGSTPYTYPQDMPHFAMHFTWPSRDYMDDRDTNRSSGNTEQPPGTTNTGMFMHLLGSLDYYNDPDTAVMHQYLNEVRAATDDFGNDRLWVEFLFVDPNGPLAPLSSLLRSYLAQGMGMVAARSDWSTDASWMSFRSGQYVGSADQGEQYPDQGSLALVHGNTPLLVNASGWIVHELGGTADENRIYNDNRGSFSSSNLYSGNSQLYNIFYVRHMNGTSLAEPFGERNYNPTEHVRTSITAFEDESAWVYSKGSHIEDMYKTFSGGAAVASWSREILYLRPHAFIVYDRTRKGASSYDQYMAFHFPAPPSNASIGQGQKRVNVKYNGVFAGSATFVYPANATLRTTALYPGSNPVKAWQMQVRPPTSNVEQRWLSVFDTAASSSQVAATHPVTVTSGNVLGVRLIGSNSNVVLASTTDQDSPLNSAFSYKVPAHFTRYIVIGMQPRSTWSVNVVLNGATQIFSVTPGGSLVASQAGVLSYVANAQDVVKPGDSMLFDGFEH